jgi:hypothetical protein
MKFLDVRNAEIKERKEQGEGVRIQKIYIRPKGKIDVVIRFSCPDCKFTGIHWVRGLDLTIIQLNIDEICDIAVAALVKLNEHEVPICSICIKCLEGYE